MTKQTPIQMLQELAQTRVDEATRRLATLMASEHACEVKLEMLIQYRSEYRERYKQAVGTGIGLDALRNYTTFLGKLEEAVAQQQKVVEQSRRNTQHGQQQWVHERNRMKAFDTLSARQQAQQTRKELRSEQRQSDEHAAKRFQDQERLDEDDEG